MKTCSVIDAPSDLGLRPTGVDGLPDALRAAGLLEGLRDVRHAGRIPVPPYVPLRDPSTGVLNPGGIAGFSLLLAERMAFTLDLRLFPLVLGGDCSILLGAALALRRRGRFGLFFIDGHADFYSPESEPNGEVASMVLAVVTGREPAVLADLDGLRPLVREEDVVVFGFRDGDSAVASGSPDVRQTAMQLFDLTEVRRLGAAEAARRGLAALEASGVEGLWVHLDADVLNDVVMPAVDYRMPEGLWPRELTEALTVVLASPLAAGMEVTIYNPNFDNAERSAARALARAVTSAFATVT
ncbi:MAG: arginase family protein [Deltaproteobacteria bacterium]|nr:arginase family protein [Deltaproteobacteria bacterium]